MDTDRVQDYVYESARLPEVRGASALLEWLGESLPSILRDPSISLSDMLGDNLDPQDGLTGEPPEGITIPGDVDDRAASALQRLRQIRSVPGFQDIEVIYSAGGSLLARAQARHALDIGRCVEDLYAAVTLAAGATCATVPLDEDHFRDCYRLLGRRLRRAKDSKLPNPGREDLPRQGEERCSSCDVRVRVGDYVRRWEDEPTARPICSACMVKNRASALAGMLGRLKQAARATDQPVGTKLARDLGEIATRRSSADIDGKAYVAAIYMDGDGMGRVVERRAKSPEGLRDFSTDLKAAMEACVLHSLVEMLPASEGLWPFQVVYVGGDDLFVLVPAGDALHLARAIARRFEEEMAAHEVTMSAGIVVAHPHYPVYFLHRIAKALCSSAKRKSPGSVDFEVLRSGSVPATDVKRLRGLLRPVDPPSGRIERRSLTMRPFTWQELDALLTVCEAFSSYPKGQLSALARSCLEGRLVGTSHFLYQLGRTPGQDGGEALKMLVDAFGAASPPPWRATQVGREGQMDVWDYATALGDVLDLHDIIAFR